MRRALTIGWIVSASGLIAGTASAATILSGNEGFVLRSLGSIDINEDAAVGGTIGAVGQIDIGRDSSVSGSVSYGTNYNPHGTATVGGSVVQNASAFSSVTQPTFLAEGTENQNLGSHQTATIAAGQYRNLNISNNSTVNLSAGDYSFRNFDIGHDSVLNVDTTGGDVFIYAHRGVDFNSRAVVNVIGSGSLYLITDDRVNIGNDALITANIFAFGSREVELNEGVEFTGSIYAAEHIEIKDDVVISASGPSGPVPAPGAAALLALGGVFACRRRRA